MGELGKPRSLPVAKRSLDFILTMRGTKKGFYTEDCYMKVKEVVEVIQLNDDRVV